MLPGYNCISFITQLSLLPSPFGDRILVGTMALGGVATYTFKVYVFFVVPSWAITTNLVVMAQDGTTKNTYTLNVYVATPPSAIVPTNILSPNGDGSNDSWVIKDIQLYPGNIVTIYDKAGRAVYTKHNYN